MKGSRPLTKKEAQKIKIMFSGKMAKRNLALFLVGANTGFRVSELLSLTLVDVLDESGKMKDRIAVQRRYMKGKKSSRSVKLNQFAKNGLTPWLVEMKERQYIHCDDFLFHSIRGNYPIDRIQAWRVLTSAFKLAGLTGKLGTHAMRKTFANNIYSHFLKRLAAGEAVDAFRSTSKALGHTDIKSTDQYLSFLTEDIDESIEATGV